MNENTIKTISIIGGGSAGWLTALALKKILNGINLEITLVVDDQQKSSELPWLTQSNLNFHNQLGIDEMEFVKNSGATFSLGTQFYDWGIPGRNFFQPHGPHGNSLNFLDFLHFAIKARVLGDKTSYEDYAFAASAAKAGKFVHPQGEQQSLLSALNYSHNINLEQYLGYIQKLAIQAGVTVVNSAIEKVKINMELNSISSIVLANGKELSSDFYIDNSGTNSLLLGKLKGASFNSWDQFIPFDRRILLSRRADLKNSKPLCNVRKTDFGYIRDYCSQTTQHVEFTYDSSKLQEYEALNFLNERFERPSSISDAFTIKNGQQDKYWIGNCMAIGNTAIDFSPLGVSSLQTTQEAIQLFVELYPNLDNLKIISHEYNRIFKQRLNSLRDYLCLFFTKLSNEIDLPIPVESTPQSLQEKIELFKTSGKVRFQEREFFGHNYWYSAFLGLEFWPENYNQFLDAFDFQELSNNYQQMLAAIHQTTEQLPNHLDYLKSGLQ
jgi:tryptophan 7-halogenase